MKMTNVIVKKIINLGLIVDERWGSFLYLQTTHTVLLGS